MSYEDIFSSLVPESLTVDVAVIGGKGGLQPSS